MYSPEESQALRRIGYLRGSRKNFIMKKIDLENNLDLQNKITEAFTNPDKYLDTNEKDMIIGRVTAFPRLEKLNFTKRYSTFGSGTRLTRTNSYLERTIKLTKSVMNSTKSESKRKMEKRNSYIINEKGIHDIYNKFKQIKKNNVDHNLDICDDDLKVKKEMKKILETQEKIIKTQEEFKAKSEKMAKYIATKTKKKDEDVLMNKTDGFRIKQELKTTIELKKPIEERYGNNNWMISLRRPENFEGTRYSFVNYGSSEKVNWVRIKEKLPENNFMETIRLPDSISMKDVRNMKSFKSFNKTLYEKYNIDLDEMPNTNGMMVIYLISYNLYQY